MPGMAIWPVEPAGVRGRRQRGVSYLGWSRWDAVAKNRAHHQDSKVGKSIFAVFNVLSFIFKHEEFVPQLMDTFPIIRGRVFNINIATEL